MVKTRGSSRRRSTPKKDAASASNQTTDDKLEVSTKQQDDVAGVSENLGEKETSPVSTPGAAKGKRKSTDSTSDQPQTSDSKKQQLANTTTKITTTNNNANVSNNDDAMADSNELSKLIPGYRAPLKLSCTSLDDKYRPVGGLEALRRQAVRTDASTAPMVAGTKDHQKHTKVMLQKSKSGGGLPVSYAAAYSSFKKGTKPMVKNDAGKQWFGMAPTPVTDELKRDLALIRNRNYLDPKRFYKSSDATGKVVQLGTVIEGAAEFYSSRLSKKQRRANLTDEIMADPAVASYAQNKFQKMQHEKAQNAKSKHKGRRSGGKR
jgi:hypothetical protein